MIGAMAMLFGVGVLLGVDMMYFVFRPEPRRPPFYMQWAHGLSGAIAVAIAAYVLSTGMHDPGAYGWPAFGFVLVALMLGLALYFFGHKLRHQRGLVITMHGFVGALGAAILAAWAL